MSELLSSESHRKAAEKKKKRKKKTKKRSEEKQDRIMRAECLPFPGFTGNVTL